MEGAGKAGRATHPQPRMQDWKAYEHSHHRFAGRARPSLRNGFNGFLRALPGDRAFLPPSPARSSPANLTPASGRQDHTTSPSASGVARPAPPPRPPHPAPNVLTMRNAPPEGHGMVRHIQLICDSENPKYFCKRGWTNAKPEVRLICPTGRFGIVRLTATRRFAGVSVSRLRASRSIQGFNKAVTKKGEGAVRR